jgi:hypothetical protein
LDEPRTRAEQIARAGLLAGIAGNARSRDEGLEAALSQQPDCGLARWHLGQIRLGDEWLTIEEIEQRRAEDERLWEYRQLRGAAQGDPRRELALAGWCHRQGFADAERLHLYQVLRNRSADQSTRKKAMRRLGLESYAGKLLPEAESARLKREAEALRQNLSKWLPEVEKWRKAIEGNHARERNHALERLRAVNDVAAVPALERGLSARG